MVSQKQARRGSFKTSQGYKGFDIILKWYRICLQKYWKVQSRKKEKILAVFDDVICVKYKYLTSE